MQKDQYLDIPLRFDLLKRKNMEHPRSNLEKSIAQNIFLMVTTRLGENRFDHTYGCEIWHLDFELVGDQNRWKERIRKSIESCVVNHESRLSNVTVDVELNEEEVVNQMTGGKSVKKRLQLRVKGISNKTGEVFDFSTKLFIAPVSVD